MRGGNDSGLLLSDPSSVTGDATELLSDSV